MNLRQLLRTGLVLFLFFPFLFLVWRFPHGLKLDAGEFWWAFLNSFWQAFGSASFSLLLGLWGGLGLICFSGRLKRHWRILLEIFLLLPNFLPPLFVLLAVLNLVDPFPMGLPGMILVHTVMNWGLVAVLSARLIESRIGAMAELAWVEGASFRRFFKDAFWPLLWRDLGYLWLFVFVICFSSFAVPLVVGGGRGTTLEVLIYEKIRFSTNWSEAVVIASLQSLFLFALSWIVTLGRSVPSTEARNLSLLRMPSGVVMSILMSALLLLGYFQGFPQGFSQIAYFFDLKREIGNALMGSLSVGLLTGLLSFFFLVTAATLLPSAWFSRILSGYVAPSSALAGFAFLTLGPNGGLWPLLKIPLALTLIFLPGLWRMGWQSLVENLQNQKSVAESLGASELAIWKDILLPQLAPAVSTLSGIAAVWACGDFAISKIVASRDVTLGMMTETLISSGYRLGLATLLSAGLLMVSLICFFAMKGLGYVLGRKPVS